MGDSSGSKLRSDAAGKSKQCCAFVILSASIVLGCTSAAFGFGGPDRTEPQRLPLRDRLSISLPFRLYNRYAIVVDGAFGALGPMHLLVDTGTDPAVIDVRTAQELGLRGVREAMQVFTGKMAVERVAIPAVDIGPIHQRFVPAVISDLGFLDREVGSHIDAIIGLGVLGGGSFTIDYKRKEIAFGRVEQKQEVAFSTGPPFVTVEISFAGQPMKLLVDTGTSGLVLFRSRVKGKLDKIQLDQFAQARNIQGKFNYETVVLPKTRLGKEDLGPVAAFLVQDKPDLTGFDGLLGIPLLHPKRLSFDFDKRVLSWAGSW